MTTLLAFVGAVSALSITRAYGVIFMGQARDDTLPDGHEPGGWMLTPLLMRSTGTVLLGLMPVLGLALVTLWPLLGMPVLIHCLCSDPGSWKILVNLTSPKLKKK